MAFDSYTKFLSHFNGLNGSTQIQDSGNTGHIVTCVNGANTSTAQAKIGSSSLSLASASSQYLSVPSNANWQFGSGLFTIEGFYYFSSTASSVGFFNQTQDGNNGYFCDWRTSNRIYFGAITGASWSTLFYCSFTPSATTWYHIAVRRNSTANANTAWSIFIDGVEKTGADLTLDAGAWNGAIGTYTGAFEVGRSGAISGYYMNGYCDEFRVSNVARTVTVPTTAYTSDSNTKLLLHMESLDVATNKPLTFVGTAQISLQPKIGTGCGRWNGSSSSLSTPDHADWTFSNNPFTIETWANFTSISPAQQVIWSQGEDVYQHFFRYNGNGTNTLDFSVYENGWILQFTCPFTPIINTWYKIDVVRVNSDNAATGWRIYINGVGQTLTKTQGNWNASLANISGACYVGSFFGAGQYFTGHLDEYRISNVARNSVDYTPSTSAFTTDANTKLLLHLDGDVVDDESSPKTITNTAVALSKFSGALLLDGDSDYVTVPDSADWDFGSGNFTIEGWFNFASLTGNQGLFGQAQDGDNRWGIRKDNTTNKLRMSWTVATVSKGSYVMTNNWSANANQWYHLAFVRNGTTGLIFIDGVSQTITETTAFGTNDLGSFSGTFNIGEALGGDLMNGYIDEPRISKGIARWTSNFTPPTKEYSAGFPYSWGYII